MTRTPEEDRARGLERQRKVDAYPKLVESLTEFVELLDGDPSGATALGRATHKATALLYALGEFKREEEAQ